MSPQRPYKCDRCQSESALHRINIPDSSQFYLICHHCIVALVCTDMQEAIRRRGTEHARAHREEKEAILVEKLMFALAKKGRRA